ADWDAAVRARLEESEIVLTGSVSEVEQAGILEQGEGSHWSVAVVDVWRVLRGIAGQTVGVLFPTIAGPRYRRSPRFVQGQTGLWVLRTQSAISTALARDGPYT